MAKKSSVSAGRWITIGCGTAMLIMAGGGILVFADHTVINFYIWFGVMLALGVLTSGPCMRFWRWLLGSIRRFWMVLAHTVTFTLVLSALLLGVNYLGVEYGSLPQEKAVVVRKYSETRYHSKRVGRRTYSRGAPYKVYKMEVEFADGLKRDFPLVRERYGRIHKGDTILVGRGRGILGMPVIDVR